MIRSLIPTTLTRLTLAAACASVMLGQFGLPMSNAATTTQAATTSPDGPAVDETSAIARATNDAIARLYHAIRKEPIFRDVEAGDVIDALDAQADMLLLLGSTQPVGAPRAITENAVQVRLEIAGTRVSDFLVAAAAAKPNQTPLAARRLQSLTASWDQKTFIAVGSSLGEYASESGNGPASLTEHRSALQGGIGSFEPHGTRSTAVSGTQGVMPTDPLIDLEHAARRDAAERFIHHLETDTKLNELGLNQMLREQSVRDVLLEQVALSRADLVDASDQAIRVELQVDSVAIAGEIEKLIGSKAPADLANLVANHAPSAVGFARAPENESPLSSLAKPEWAANPIGVEASRAPAGSPLQTARAAERAARIALAEKIAALPVDDVHTILDVMLEDEVIRLRMETLVQEAQLAGIDYEPAGEVRVRISVDGSRIWAALTAD